SLSVNTMPVGAAPPGSDTTRGLATPSPLYSVDVSAPLSAIHQGPASPRVRPHELINAGSTCGAETKPSETSGMTWYRFRPRGVASIEASEPSEGTNRCASAGAGIDGDDESANVSTNAARAAGRIERRIADFLLN